MADSVSTFRMFVFTMFISLIIGNFIHTFILNMLGIEVGEAFNRKEASLDEKNLYAMANATCGWVAFSTGVLAAAVFTVSDSVMLGVLFATLLTPAFWYFATTRMWPKVKNADFSNRFAWALKRFE